MMSLASVGIVVARRQPGNPLGWMFLALAARSALGVSAGAYAVLSYRLGHHLLLGVAAVFLAQYWCPVRVHMPVAVAGGDGVVQPGAAAGAEGRGPAIQPRPV
jgi:hypothetical protein